MENGVNPVGEKKKKKVFKYSKSGKGEIRFILPNQIREQKIQN